MRNQLCQGRGQHIAGPGQEEETGPRAGAGPERLQPRSGVFLSSFLCLMNWLPKQGICVPGSHIFPFSNPSSAKQTQVPPTFRRPVLFPLLSRLNPWVETGHTPCLQSMGRHSFLRLKSTWLSFRSVLVLLFLSSRLEVWKKNKHI